MTKMMTLQVEMPDGVAYALENMEDAWGRDGALKYWIEEALGSCLKGDDDLRRANAEKLAGVDLSHCLNAKSIQFEDVVEETEME